MNILDDHLFCYTYRFVTIKLFLYDTYQTLSKERRDKVTKVTEVRLQKTENWMRKCIDSSVQRAWQGNGKPQVCGRNSLPYNIDDHVNNSDKCRSLSTIIQDHVEQLQHLELLIKRQYVVNFNHQHTLSACEIKMISWNWRGDVKTATNACPKVHLI